MALVSSSDPDLRIYEPGFSTEYSSRKEEADHRSCLLAKIHNAYCKALERFTTSSKVLAGGGFCFGLLDPASNIIANTLIPCTGEAKIEDLEHRSLQGMVTFLTRFFPYLADCEAVRYLLLADADLLVATRLIVIDRCMKRFGSSELAVEEALRMALKCAALVARHPHPDRFVGAWLTISCRLDDVVHLLAKVQRCSPSSNPLDHLIALLAQPGPPVDDRRGDLLRASKLATSRPPRPRNLPYQNTSTPLKRALLDAIHGFYLQALARLPAGELHSRYQRSLLMAGHCYGPLDPVSNILLNTIWYDAACPCAKKLELGDMISTMGLLRIETRSMYGLISFLCTRYHDLSFHRACRCLLKADANLLLADPNLDAHAFAAATAALRSEERTRRLRSPWGTATGFHKALTSRVDTEAQGPDCNVIKAFTAAATAGWHPKPDDQAKFLTSCKQVLGSDIALLQGDGQLSSEDVQRLSRLLSAESPHEKPLLPLPYKDLPLSVKEYVRTHTRVCTKVKAALDAYALMPNGEPCYELHTICGFNNLVSGPVYCPEIDTYPPEKFCHTHVNFLATPKGSTRSHNNETPVLFFVEISNEDEDKAGTQLCCPVWAPPPCAERVRCLYCDYWGIRIVHPSGEKFSGREEHFEDMVCEKDPYDENFDPLLMSQYYTNECIISDSRYNAERVRALEEDCLYSGFDEDKETDDYDTDMDYATDEYELI